MCESVTTPIRLIVNKSKNACKSMSVVIRKTTGPFFTITD